MVNASKKAGLGRTLGKAQKNITQKRNPRKSDKHTVETNPGQDNARLDLKSVTAQTNLDEFLEEVELAGKQFITERRNVKLINDQDATETNLYEQHERLESKAPIEIDDKTLSVPRRPKWDANTTPEQLEELEKRSFLTWRRKLATLQEDATITLTPFEKNLEVWRQLWRVIERSDIVVQILDCRNPLLYLCDDLIKYVEEEFKGEKMNLILLNKADYLTLEQRRIWAKYFRDRNIKFIFFSALFENENLNSAKHEDSENESVQEENDDEEIAGTDSHEVSDHLQENKVAEELESNLNINNDLLDEDRIYNKFELIDTWREILLKLKCDTKQNVETEQSQQGRRVRLTSETVSEHSSNTSHNRPLTVGLVGYPNVGKSSTINALLSAKRVAVSATPGKTKHFQTFLIDRDMMLCDCPGLVFPNFVQCKSEMVINGVLPIDQMKDCIGPVRIIVSRIPRSFFEDIYGLAFENDAKQNITADDLLNAFGFMRGYMTARGLPDVSRASRKICKDYINGKILYCEPPPGTDKKVYHNHSKLAEAMEKIEERRKDPRYALRITERQRRLMVLAKGNDISSKEFDIQFFQSRTGGAHIKGLPGIGNLTQPVGKYSEQKQGKHEKRHKKKEKLRRVYNHLDN